MIHLNSNTGTSFPTWLLKNGLSFDADALFDADADEMPFWFEYLYDLKPLLKENPPAPSWRMVGGAMEVNFGIVQTDGRAVIQSSNDLISWETIDQPITDWVQVSSDSSFVRLRWMDSEN